MSRHTIAKSLVAFVGAGSLLLAGCSNTEPALDSNTPTSAAGDSADGSSTEAAGAEAGTVTVTDNYGE